MNTTPKSVNEDPPEPSTKCMQVNLFGVYYTTQLSIYYMGQAATTTETETPDNTELRNNEKSLILVGSLAGYHAIPQAPEYTASKYGVRGILKSMRTETEAVGLRLNTIAPTYIDTPLLAEEELKALKAGGVQFAEVQTAVNAVMVLSTHNGIHGTSFH